MHEDMKQKMRRKDRLISDDEALELLKNGEYGILSCIDENNQPYGVPLSYVLYNDYLYFHSALVGSKINNIKHNDKVSFCVVGKTQPIYNGDYTTFYESVMVFGKASIVLDVPEKTKSLIVLTHKYLPQHMDKMQEELEKSAVHTLVFKMSLDQITAKANKAMK